jgi:predicted porin
VTLSGLVDAGYQSVDLKGVKNAGVAHNGRSTSTIQIAGTEDLGGGLKANFKLNSDFDATRGQTNTGTASTTDKANTNSSWLNSEKFVSLESAKLGTVKLGVVNNLSLATFGVGTNFGTAVGSGFRAVTATDVLGQIGASTAVSNGKVPAANASAVRFDKSVQYVTPSFAGFTAAANIVKKNTGGAATTFSSTQGAYDLGGVKEFQVAYANGPLNVSATQQKQDSVGTDATKKYESTMNSIGANYTIGAAKVFAFNQTAKADEDGTTAKFDTKYTSFGANYTMGATTLLAQTGSYKNQLVTSGSNKTTLTSLGADYALSKRTTAYVRYEKIKDEGSNLFVASAGQAGDIKRTALGLVHSF